jgi:putative ABC transport system permease protein
VPVVTLVVYLVIAAGVGVLAAIGPARRASRVNILQAITVE